MLNVLSIVDRKVINEIRIRILPEEEEEEKNAEPLIEEIRRALSQMKSGKVPVNDEAITDLLKAGEEPVIYWFYEIFVNIRKNEVMVQD